MDKQYAYYMKNSTFDMMLPVPSKEVALQWAMEKIALAFGKR